MELHRLDGLPISGLDNVDIQDIDLDGYDSEEIDFEELDDDDEELDFSGLGYVKDPMIAYEILDEYGNVVMYADADENIYTVDGLGELGFFKKIGKGLKKLGKKIGKGVKNATKFTVKKVVKPVVKFTNRYLNPGTILLRNGFLLAMKLNFMKVAEKLRFGYLSDAEARRRGVNMNGFSKLKKAISSAEKVYETAGGKRSNLRKAILSGKGNKDKAVPLSGSQLNGLGLVDEGEYVDEFERFVAEADEEAVEALLQGEMSIEGLGAVATGSALAAASSAVAAVAAVLNKITGVFDKAKKAKDTVSHVVNTGKSLVNTGKGVVNTAQSLVRPGSPALPLRLPTGQNQLPASFRTMAQHTAAPSANFEAEARQREARAAQEKAMQEARAVQKVMNAAKVASQEVAKAAGKTTDKTNNENKESWFDKNKILVIGTGILVAGGGIAYAVVQSKKKNTTKPMAGLPKGKAGAKKKKPVPKRITIAPKTLL
ncbi:hypothetical protein JMN32_05370 [Fulvivirga sp. 29W222]|uniref:Transmembrane protein n=1 Tax=Fulvivirga marina TaxID=2494733 RepID=A0A937KD02_9BACT|nr:hypothetical protein [Fulvivirga marina]MBL6445728.1 hypothetical protein [Fulvivirga marina]